MSAAYEIRVSDWLGSNGDGDNYTGFVQDVVKYTSVQLSIQLMLTLADPGGNNLSDFLILVLYIVVGLALYWLVVRKLVAFT